MNVIIIGDKDDEIGLNLWKRMEFASLIHINKLNKSVEEYMKHHITIGLLSEDILAKIKPNTFVRFCNKVNALPFFISDKPTHTTISDMFYTLRGTFKNSLLYVRNDKNEDLMPFIRTMDMALRSK